MFEEDNPVTRDSTYHDSPAHREWVKNFNIFLLSDVCTHAGDAFTNVL